MLNPVTGERRRVLSAAPPAAPPPASTQPRRRGRPRKVPAAAPPPAPASAQPRRRGRPRKVPAVAPVAPPPPPPAPAPLMDAAAHRAALRQRNGEIGASITLWRRLRGVSQQQLAAAIGLTFQQVQKYESGANRVGAGRLYHIAQVLRVGVGTLLGPPLPLGDAVEVPALLHDYWRIPPAIRAAVLHLAQQLGDSDNGNSSNSDSQSQRRGTPESG